METIINLKKVNLLYQSYIPNNIFNCSTLIIKILQDNCNLISDSIKLLANKKEDELNLNGIKNFTSEVLLLIANTEESIKTRLKELSNIPGKSR